MKTVRKLIEVALPLDDLNRAAAREKSIRHGHPSTLHLWWARRPLAAARAVLFAQLVDDPSSRPELFPTEEEQEQERKRLFAILRELVKWENTTNEELLEGARAEIRTSWRRTCADNAGHPRAAELFDPERLPAFHDPFAGGGAIPLEAQRLGLEAHASDLNPVAVLINKAMIEIPPKFAGRPPVPFSATTGTNRDSFPPSRVDFADQRVSPQAPCGTLPDRQPGASRTPDSPGRDCSPNVSPARKLHTEYHAAAAVSHAATAVAIALHPTRFFHVCASRLRISFAAGSRKFWLG